MCEYQIKQLWAVMLQNKLILPLHLYGEYIIIIMFSSTHTGVCDLK